MAARRYPVLWLRPNHRVFHVSYELLGNIVNSQFRLIMKRGLRQFVPHSIDFIRFTYQNICIYYCSWSDSLKNCWQTAAKYILELCDWFVLYSWQANWPAYYKRHIIVLWPSQIKTHFFYGPYTRISSINCRHSLKGKIHKQTKLKTKTYYFNTKRQSGEWANADNAVSESIRSLCGCQHSASTPAPRECWVARLQCTRSETGELCARSAI